MGAGVAGAIVAVAVFVVSVAFWAGYNYSKVIAFEAAAARQAADMLQVMRRLTRIEQKLRIAEDS